MQPHGEREADVRKMNMQQSQHDEQATPALPRRVRHQSRGSALVIAYFVMAVILGFAIPQTMRSMQSIQLESRYITNKQLFHVSEAGVDYAIKTILPANPFFGVLNDDAVSHTLGNNTNFPGVPGCPIPYQATWDCWSSNLQLPGGYIVNFRAQNVGPPNANGTTLKRIRMVATAPPPSTQTIVQEVVLSVTQKFATGTRAGTRLVIQLGNGVENNILQGDEIRVYGPVTGNSWSDVPIAVEGNQAIWGKVLVKNSGTGLCCNPYLNPPNAVGLGNGNTADGARIRQLNYDINGVPVGGLIVASNGQGMTGVSPAPDFLPPGEDTYTFTPVKMDYASETTDCVADVGGSGAGGSANAIITFCPIGDPSAECQGNQTDPNPVFRTGVTGPNGVVEYCVNSLWAPGGGAVRFKGSKVRVYARGYQDFSGVHKAYSAAPLADIYAYRSNPTDLSESNTGELSLRVLESNRWVQDVNGNWVRDSAANWGKDLPPGAMVPDVRLSGDTFYGTVNAPRSEVHLNMNQTDTRTAESIVGKLVSISNIVRVRPQQDTDRGTLDGTPKVVGWHKCVLSVPSDPLSPCTS